MVGGRCRVVAGIDKGVQFKQTLRGRPGYQAGGGGGGGDTSVK